MVWFKVDDALAFHMKAITAGNSALGLWVRAGSWSMQQLTDGFIPQQIVTALGGADDDAAALVTGRLWDEAPGGFQFHDWAAYQPTREQVLAERDAAAERMRRVRANKQKNVRANKGRTNGAGSASPSRPVPSRPHDLTLTNESRPEVDASVSTDSMLPPAVQALASAAGITSVPAIVEQIRKWTQREVTPEVAVGIARHLLAKSKGDLKWPQRYVARAISQSPLEVQKHIDERGLAA